MGIVFTLLPCLIGSTVYSFNIYYHFNNTGGFYFTLFDVVILGLILLFLSVVISIPFVFYIDFLIRKISNSPKKSVFENPNFIFLIYSTLLFLLFSNLMSNYVEGMELTLAYIISGFISLNLYLTKKIKRVYNHLPNNS